MANQLRAGNLIIDRKEYLVRVDGRPVELTRAEFELLSALTDSRGRVLSPRELGERVFGPGSAGPGRKLAVHISRLRKKIAGSRPWRIRTVVKRGYSLSEVVPLSQERDDVTNGRRKVRKERGDD